MSHNYCRNIYYNKIYNKNKNMINNIGKKFFYDNMGKNLKPNKKFAQIKKTQKNSKKNVDKTVSVATEGNINPKKNHSLNYTAGQNWKHQKK